MRPLIPLHERLPRLSVDEAIADELRMYPDPESFRANTWALSRQYSLGENKLALVGTLVYHARLMDATMKLAHRRDPDEPPSVDRDFLAGETLALHASMQSMGPRLARHFLSKGIQLDINPQNPIASQGAYVEHFLSRVDHPFLHVQASLSKRLGAMVTQAAVLYGHASTTDERSLFVGGYLNAVDCMEGVARLHPPILY